jgi:hypothetical protein
MSSIIWSTFTEPVGDMVPSCDVRGGDGAGAGWSQGVAPLRLGGILVWVISESVLGPPSLGDKTRGVIGAWFARNRRDRSQNTAINKPSTRTPKMGPTIFPTVAACEELALVLKKRLTLLSGRRFVHSTHVEPDPVVEFEGWST